MKTSKIRNSSGAVAVSCRQVIIPNPENVCTAAISLLPSLSLSLSLPPLSPPSLLSGSYCVPPFLSTLMSIPLCIPFCLPLCPSVSFPFCIHPSNLLRLSLSVCLSSAYSLTLSPVFISQSLSLLSSPPAVSPSHSPISPSLSHILVSLPLFSSLLSPHLLPYLCFSSIPRSLLSMSSPLVISSLCLIFCLPLHPPPPHLSYSFCFFFSDSTSVFLPLLSLVFSLFSLVFPLCSPLSLFPLSLSLCLSSYFSPSMSPLCIFPSVCSLCFVPHLSHYVSPLLCFPSVYSPLSLPLCLFPLSLTHCLFPSVSSPLSLPRCLFSFVSLPPSLHCLLLILQS